jgi:alanine racemase
MTLRLTIHQQAWRTHVQRVCDQTTDLVPVIKGNGYGFGRQELARLAATFADEIAVGTVHELADVADVIGRPDTPIIALTPALSFPENLAPNAVPTVGSVAHVDALIGHGWRGPVAIKLESSMHRHGASPASFPQVQAAVLAAGCRVHQYVLHLPLQSGSFTIDLALPQVEQWLPHLDPAVAVSISHLPVAVYDTVRSRHRHRSFRMRAGTALWHGDKSFLHLSADVLEVRPTTVGQPLGYRQLPSPVSGHVVMVGAGSAHGIAPLDGVLSPFHFARERVPLAEPPHMHTSMIVIGDGSPVPDVGDWVDVQRPLTMVAVDSMHWR